MKQLINKLFEITAKQGSNYRIEELNKIVDVSYETKKEYLCDFDVLDSLLKKFPKRDTVCLEICDITDEVIRLSNNSLNEKKLYDDFKDSLSENEIIDISIHIEKDIRNNCLTVYNFEAFKEYLLGLNETQLMEFVDEDLRDNNQLIFELNDNEFLAATSSLIFCPIENDLKREKINRKERIIERKKNCYIFWRNDYLPIPEDFHFIIEKEVNPFKEVFKRIETILSIVYITDNARFFDNQMTCQLYGKRMNTINVTFENINYNSVLFDIYKWIYTEGNIVDKVTLARNLLSIHCRNIFLQNIDEQTFLSIKANFSIYQKENVDKYIELKNKLTEFLSMLVDESKNVVLAIVGDIGKNIVAFFSFMLTVFVTSIMSEKGLEMIFTKDVTIFAEFFILCSLMYVYITHIITGFRVKKLEESYQMMKDNNSFFEGTKEYKEIFDDNKVDKITKDIYKWEKKLRWIWIGLIVVVFIIVEKLSVHGIVRSILSFVINNVIKPLSINITL